MTILRRRSIISKGELLYEGSEVALKGKKKGTATMMQNILVTRAVDVAGHKIIVFIEHDGRTEDLLKEKWQYSVRATIGIASRSTALRSQK